VTLSDVSPVHRDVRQPDPTRIATRRDFGRELSLARERAGLTVRAVAKATGMEPSTLGGYFGGRHLPPVRARQQVIAILRECGITDPEGLEQWLDALDEARRKPEDRAVSSPGPYRGLTSYQPEDAAWFHGRQLLTERLLRRIADSPGGTVIPVVGPSGSGKSSLLRAGLVPALGCGEHAVAGFEDRRHMLFTPGQHPMCTLAERLDGAAPEGLVVIVDQFEELFTSCVHESERAAFVQALSATAPTVVVLGLRADFYAEALRHPVLVLALQDAQLVVGPMTEAELRKAITGPAFQAGIELEDGLIELLLGDFARGDATEVGALPLLSHALLTTWARSRRGRMKVADYRATGGVGGAVAATAEAAYDGLPPPQRHVARQLFGRLVQVADDHADTRRRVVRGELPAGTELVLDRFVEQRLVTADTGTVEIAHEALLTAWPRLREWIDADRVGLRLHRILTQAAVSWEQAGRDPSALYRGARLVTALEWAGDPAQNVDLNALEREFLDVGHDHALAEQRADRNRTRRLRQLLAAVTVLLVVATGLTAYALVQRGTATEQRDLAISRQIAVEANRLRSTDMALAAQLSLVAYRLAPTVEARSSLLASSATPAVTRVPATNSVMQAVGVSPDGATMATAGVDANVRLWDLADPGAPVALDVPLVGHTDTVYSVAFSSNSALLATGSGDRTVRLWDVTDPRQPLAYGSLTGGPSETVYSVAFSPDGRVLAAGGADGVVQSWDVSDPGDPRPLPAPPPLAAAVQSVTFSPDSALLAVGMADGTVMLGPAADPARGVVLAAGERAVYSVAFAPDGRALAAAGADENVMLWDVSDSAVPVPLGEPLAGPKSRVNSVAFSADGRLLVAASSDNTVQLWDRNTGRLLTVLPHPGPVTAVAFLPGDRTLATSAADGVARLWAVPGPTITGPADTVFTAAFGSGSSTLTIGSSDGTVGLWDITDRQRPRQQGPPVTAPDGLAAYAGAAALSPDSALLAAGSADGVVQLWEVRDPQQPQLVGVPLSGPTAVVESLAFSPDGRTLAVGSDDEDVWLWDVTTVDRPKLLATPHVPGGFVFGVAFSPDGRTLAAGSVDRTVRLWDISDPRTPMPLGDPLLGPGNYVYSVAFSPDGQTLAAGSADKTVRLWDIKDRSRPLPLGQPLRGSSSTLYSVAFAPDGRTLAAASGDGQVWMWSVTDRAAPTLWAVLSASQETLFSVTFDRSGRALAAGGTDAMVRTWSTDPANVAAQICATAGETISSSELQQFVPDLAYRPPCAG